MPDGWRPPSNIADSVRPFFDSLARSADSSAELDTTTRGAALAPLKQPSYDSIANVTWFDLLQDTVLRSIVATAVEENKDVHIALATIKEFRALVGVAKGPLWPQISANGVIGREKAPVGALAPVTFDEWSATANLTWELDFWGRIRRGVEAAQNDFTAQEQNERATVLTLVSDVATTYIVLRELDQDLDISRRTLESRKETYRLALERYQQGVISELDVRQFESDVAGAAVSVAQFERQVAQQENALSVLLGHNPGAVPRGRPLRDVVSLVSVPVDLPASLLERRPDVLAAEAAYSSATARIGQAIANRFPKFTITGQYGSQADALGKLFQNRDTEIYQALFGVSIPIFTGGQLSNQVKAQRAIAEQARYGYERAVIQALREVEDAMVALRTSRDELAAQQTQVLALRAAEQLAALRYQNGVSSYLDVLDAQRNLFTAEVSLTQAQRQQLVAAVQLYAALGGGWLIPGRQR